MAESRRAFDFWSSDSFWLLCAREEGELTGYATVVRVPKLDARRGFLFVDELYVLEEYRRRGTAAALVQRVCALAGELGYRGVRLLVRSENEGARALYRRLGFREEGPIFCERVL